MIRFLCLILNMVGLLCIEPFYNTIAAQTAVLQNTRLARGDDGLYGYTPAKGDELRYVVTYPDGSQYDFVITLMQYDYPGAAEFPVALRWDISEPLNSTGLIELCSACLEQSYVYLNYFKDGTYLKYTDFSTVFVSAKNFSETEKPNDRFTLMIMDGEEITFHADPAYTGFPVQANGRSIQLRTRKLNSVPGGKEVIFQPGAHRLIVAMKLNFSIELKEIKFINDK
jgi:hypothetical protein